MKPRKLIYFVSVILGLVLIASLWAVRERLEFSSDRMILLVPDGMSQSDPRVMMWLDAASEEGLHVSAVHDSEFLRPVFSQARTAGVILPDSIHQRASDAFLASLKTFVADVRRGHIAAQRRLLAKPVTAIRPCRRVLQPL